MKRTKYARADRKQAAEQMALIEKLLEGGMNMMRDQLSEHTGLSRKACLIRLTSLRNSGKVRYEQRNGTVYWMAGSMPAPEERQRIRAEEMPEIMRRWLGYPMKMETNTYGRD